MVKEWVWQPAGGWLAGWMVECDSWVPISRAVRTAMAYFTCISDPGQLSAQESGEATAPQIQP
jgi:hypothetical protein